MKHQSPPRDPADLHRLAEAIACGAQLSEADRLDVAAALRALVLPAADPSRILISCRREFFADRSERGAAQEIETGMRRYAASGWLHDRAAATCPQRIVGKVQARYWALLKISTKPLGAERIRKLLCSQ